MKFILSSLVCCYIITISFAGEVDSVRASKVAINFFSKIKTLQSTPQFKLVNWKSKQKSAMPASSNNEAVYIFNNTVDGFIIISGNDYAAPILAYSVTGEIDATNMPPALIDWLSWKESEIKTLSNKTVLLKNNAITEWEKAENNLYSEQLVMSGKDPLIKTNWGQGTNYNDLCPYDTLSDYSNNRVPVGCVATAMAQVMKYWEYPTNGISSHSYTHTKYGVQSANFGTTTYNWATMPNLVTSANAAVAALSYHCGVSVDMNYSPSGSSSSLSTGSQSLISYFNYKNTLSYVRKSDYTSTAWYNLIKSDIDNFMPVLLRGAASDGNGGHAYICDGYTINNYFHINWGWTGSYNGYFLFEDLTPGTNNFTYYQYATIGIKPNGNSCAVYPASLSISANIDSKGDLRIVSNTSWTVSSNQSWLSVSSTSGTGSAILVLTATSANTTGANRTATVTVTASGLTAKTVTVTQLPSTTNLPNFSPYKPTGWSDKIVLSKIKNTTTDDVLTTTDSVYVDFAFANNGLANATSPFYCWISIDSITIIEGIRTSLTSGYYSSSRDNALGKFSAGTHKIKMVVDPLNDIGESNETDNIYIKQFTVNYASGNVEIKPENNKLLKLFPNPATNILNISSSKSKIGDVQIISTTGVIVLYKTIESNSDIIDISHLMPGYYILQIKTGNSFFRKTFIKINP